MIDFGTSLSISPCKSDFLGNMKKVNLRLGGMENGMIIEVKGEVEWTFSTGGGKNITIRALFYYVPDYKARLSSRQRLFNTGKGFSGSYIVEDEHSTLAFDGLSPLVIDYDSINWLPTATACNLKFNHSINFCVTCDDNQNITLTKKRLLHWHYIFGNLNLRDIQLMLINIPFESEKFLASSKIPFEKRPRCAICQHAKARRKTVHVKNTQIYPTSEGDLKSNHVHPGAGVLVDHF